MFRIRIVLSLVGLWLPMAPFTTEAEGQDSPTDRAEQTPSPRIVWQQELEGESWPRRYSDRNFNPKIYEPNVGIDLDSTRANPVRMAATLQWIYLFDEEGHIEQRIPLRRDPSPDEVKALTPLTIPDYIEKVGDKKFFIRESAVTDPKGRFYIIRREKTRGYDGIWTENFRAYNADGSLRFELRNRPGEGIYIHSEFCLAPNGEYLIQFEGGGGEELEAYLDFYDTTTGALLKHMDRRALLQADIPYSSFTFSESGDHVLMFGGVEKKVAILDSQGNLIQPPEDARAKLTTAPHAQHESQQAIYRQLVNPQVPLGARPEEVGDVKMLSDQRGVYTSGNTLYLFELQPSP